jgi:uncharacterized protein YbjT (DUF2867 family)
MKILLFGATGLIGQGVLGECLKDPGITMIRAIGRGPSGASHPKLQDLVHPDLFDYRPIEAELEGFDACFFCLGTSSVGMDEQAYARVTHDLTLTAAETLARINPGMTFVYVSAAGTDNTERGSIMWARVRGRTENDLFRLPLAAYSMRPVAVQPLGGIRPRTPVYRFAFVVLAPFLPLLRRLMPGSISTTEEFGRAMIALARHGAPKRILEAADFAALARGSAATSEGMAPARPCKT